MQIPALALLSYSSFLGLMSCVQAVTQLGLLLLIWGSVMPGFAQLGAHTLCAVECCQGSGPALLDSWQPEVYAAGALWLAAYVPADCLLPEAHCTGSQASASVQAFCISAQMRTAGMRSPEGAGLYCWLRLQLCRLQSTST